MSLNYDRLKRKRSEGSDFWAAYADLYTMLSFVFLFLFAAANIRSGSQQIGKQMENLQLAKENEDLKEQIKVYSTIKENYLENKASGEEKQVYAELMDQLKLLEIETKEEANNLLQQADENRKKERALNKYQQLVRNIINTNLLAKEQIQTRDSKIVDREKTIASKEKDLKSKQLVIQTFKAEINEREKDLQTKEKALSDVRRDLDKNIARLKQQQKTAKMSQEQLKSKINEVTQQSQAKISSLEGETLQTKRQLSATREALGSAQGELAQKSEMLSQSEGARARAVASVESLKESNKSMAADLEKAKALIKAKQDLVGQIRSEFSKQGIKAQVDAKTGDITLDFGEEYFDTNSANLKPGMMKKLQSFFPAYSSALFKDKSLSRKLGNVEIIGFASPTFQGRYVNPSSLKAEDREAILYNLKLSFNRANEIFKYAFDNNKLQFEGQKSLLPMIKVVGRGYLPEGTSGDQISEGLTEKEFCQKYNCQRAQRVVIKFNLRE